MVHLLLPPVQDDGDGDDGSCGNYVLLLVVDDLRGDFDVQDGNHGEDPDHVLVLLLGEGAQKGLPVLILQIEVRTCLQVVLR